MWVGFCARRCCKYYSTLAGIGRCSWTAGGRRGASSCSSSSRRAVSASGLAFLIQSFHCRSLQEKKAQDHRVSLQTCHLLGCYLHSSPPELSRDFSPEVSSHFQHHSTCVSMEFCQPFGCRSSWMIKVVRQCAHYFRCFMVFLHRYFEVGRSKVG